MMEQHLTSGTGLVANLPTTSVNLNNVNIVQRNMVLENGNTLLCNVLPLPLDTERDSVKVSDTDPPLNVAGSVGDSDGTSLLVYNNGMIVDTARGLVLTVDSSSLNSVLSQGVVDLSTSGQFLNEGLFAQPSDTSTSEEAGTLLESAVATGASTIPTANVVYAETSPVVYPDSTQTVYTDESGPVLVLQSGRRKGGWPKGKKRKKAVAIQQPKAPATAYVIFATERRQVIRESHPHLSFSDATKLLGGEWSHMTQQQRQKYVEEAEKDKKRYIRELKTFQESSQYQMFIKKKREKGSDEDSGAHTDALETSYSDSLEDEGLYCKVCDMYFSSLHNRKEHMFGKQHLFNMTSEFEKVVRKDQEEQEKVESQVLASELCNQEVGPSVISSLSSSSCHCYDHSGDMSPSHMQSEALDIPTAIHNIMEKNLYRELELKELRRTAAFTQEENMALVTKIAELKNLDMKLEQDVAVLKSIGASLSTQIDGLRMVPTLFGVINF